MPQAPLTDGSAVRWAPAPLLTSSATSRASGFNALSLSSDLQNGHTGWPHCLGLRHRERRGRTGDAQLGALGRQLAPRHQPGQRFRWRPPFPLARPRPAGRESEPGSEILRPHSLVSFSQTLMNRPADPTCPLPIGTLVHSTGMPSALALDWLRAKP